MDFVKDVSNILNLGRYQMRIITTAPTWVGEGGEHLLYVSGSVRRLYWYDDINATWQFIEWNNSGLGQATIVATVALTGQVSSIATTTLYTPSAAGTYRVSVYHLITTPSVGAGTLDMTILWTDDESAKTNLPAAQLNLTIDQSAASGTVFIRSTATAISYSTTIGGGDGAQRYSLFLVVERLT